MQEMTIADVLKILKKRFWMIVAFCIIVMLMAGMYFQSQPDEYTAQATMFVMLAYASGDQTRYDTAAGAQFAGDFKELIRTHTVMATTLQKLKISQKTFDAVAIDINAVPGTRILRISATAQDPGLSASVANTVSQVFTEYIKGMIAADAITIKVEDAEIPDAPSGPNRMSNTMLAGVVGLLLAVGVVFAVEMLNTTLQSSEAIESALGLPVLASIQSYRKEIIRFVQKCPSNKMLSGSISLATKENINALLANIQFATIAHPIQTLILTSSIAGEGKSSILLLLAEALSDLNKSVLLVDMDMRNPSLWKYIGLRGRKDLFDYLVGHSRLEDVICNTDNPGIHFIDSHHHLASVSQIVNFEVFERFLDNVKRTYDFILFDTPPLSLFIDAAALANRMDASLMVVGNGMTNTKVAVEVVNQLHKANANILGAVLNFVDGHNGHAEYYGHTPGKEKKERVAAPQKPIKEV